MIRLDISIIVIAILSLSVWSKPKCDSTFTKIIGNDTSTTKVNCREFDNSWEIERTLNSKLHGKYELYHPSGRMAQENNYLHGKQVGVRKGWTEDGFLALIEYYHHNTPVDTHKLWFDNKEQKSITVYDSSGNKNGWCMNWYESGVLKDSTLFSEGNKLEEYLFYESGKPMFKSRMRPDGYILSSESYDPKGKRISSVKKGNGNVIVPNNWNSYDTLTVKDGKVMDPSYHFFKGR